MNPQDQNDFAFIDEEEILAKDLSQKFATTIAKTVKSRKHFIKEKEENLEEIKFSYPLKVYHGTDLATVHPNLHKIKPKLEKTTVNCVDYLGLELFQQYNSQIFWDAWI